MALAQEYVDDLVVALLSINNYPVTTTWDLLPRLRAGGLTDAQRMVVLDSAAIALRLKAAGYDRGKITDILAPRLRNLLKLANDGALDALPNLVQTGGEESVRSLLLPLKGVGPRVAATAWMLLSARAT